jgi:hypothetical protein
MSHIKYKKYIKKKKKSFISNDLEIAIIYYY